MGTLVLLSATHPAFAMHPSTLNRRPCNLVIACLLTRGPVTESCYGYLRERDLGTSQGLTDPSTPDSSPCATCRMGRHTGFCPRHGPPAKPGESGQKMYPNKSACVDWWPCGRPAGRDTPLSLASMHQSDGGLSPLCAHLRHKSVAQTWLQTFTMATSCC